MASLRLKKLLSILPNVDLIRFKEILWENGRTDTRQSKEYTRLAQRSAENLE
jgi:hypothetical protein